MTDISFDREALGIAEKAQWTDAEDLGQVGAAVSRLNKYDVALPLPKHPTGGVTALATAVNEFAYYVGCAVYEYSDACAELGSGIADYTQDADSSEKYNEAKARAAAARLGVGEKL